MFSLIFSFSLILIVFTHQKHMAIISGQGIIRAKAINQLFPPLQVPVTSVWCVATGVTPTTSWTGSECTQSVQQAVAVTVFKRWIISSGDAPKIFSLTLAF